MRLGRMSEGVMGLIIFRLEDEKTGGRPLGRGGEVWRVDFLGSRCEISSHAGCKFWSDVEP